MPSAVSNLLRLLRLQRSAQSNRSYQRGFTLMELMVVIALAGIMGTIATPSWLRFWDTQRAKGAQQQAFLAIRQAQSTAIRTNRRWRVAFRNSPQAGSQWSYYPVDSAAPSTQPNANSLRWQPLSNDIQIDAPETTLRKSHDGTWFAEFNHRGGVHGQLGRVTMIAADRPSSRRCIIVSTLGGSLREGTAVLAPSNPRQCD